MLSSSSRVVLVVCCCLLLSLSVTSYCSFRHIARTYVALQARASKAPTETVGGYTFAERTVNNVTSHTGGNSTGKPRRTVVSKNPRDWTPYIFRDADGEYDAPFINEAMWYRLSVRRNSEKKLAESLKMLRDSDDTWGKMFEEVYYPQQPVVRIKDKSLVIAFKAMAPGLVYIKTKMNPDLADDIESLKGVYAFLKNPNNLIVPLSKGEGESIEIMRDREVVIINPELMLMKKDEYVSIVSGPRKGRYGILMGAKNGKLEVCLRSEYKDDWDTFEVDQLRYLADPPEKKWMLLTPKEALESLMAKDPYNPTVKAFKKNGLLEEILYPDGRPEGGSYKDRNDRPERGDWEEKKPRENRYDSASDSQGREGGRSLRSIASNNDRSAPRGNNDRGGSDSDDWGASSSAKSQVPITPSSTGGFSDSFNIAAWGDLLQSSSVGRGKPDNQWSQEVKESRESEEVAAGGGTEDFDSFIQGLLSDMDEPPPTTDDSWNDKEESPSSSNKVITSGGKREWVPSKERLQAQSQSSNTQQRSERSEPPRKERRNDESYSKSTDWFDDRSTSYDAYSEESGSRSNSRSPPNPQVEADRIDSERILNELLMDLDSDTPSKGSGGGGDGIDYFDFSVDSEDIKSRSPTSRNQGQDRNQGSRQSAPPASSSGAGARRNVAPKMEDFGSFENYLDALVSHERTATSGGGGGGTAWDNAKKGAYSGGRGEREDSRAGAKDIDALDDTLVAFLGGDDDEDMGRSSSRNSGGSQERSFGSQDRSSERTFGSNDRSNERSNDRGNDRDSQSFRSNDRNDRNNDRNDPNKPVRSWSPKAPVEAQEAKQEVSYDDDLTSFLDSLEASNVLPSKSKVVEEKVEVKEVKEVVLKSVAVPKETPASKVVSDSSSSDLSSMTLKDLKDKLRERGLPVSGNKADLVKRLS